MFEKIKGEDLVVGEVYYDTDDLSKAAILRLVSKDKHRVLFEFVGGNDIYKINSEGLIPFITWSIEMTTFYKKVA